MRFYVEFKRPELGDDPLWEYEDSEIIPWTDDYKTLLQVNKEYRRWIEQAPQEKIEQGDVPVSIIESLKSIIKIRALLENLEDCHFDASEGSVSLNGEEDAFLLQQMKERSNLKTGDYLDLYPGIEAKTYHSSELSIAVVYFDKELDLNILSKNQKGITREDLLQLIPRVKWLSGYLELPLTLSSEQLSIEETNPHFPPWWYILRDTYFYIAGIEMNVFMGGSKYFVRDE